MSEPVIRMENIVKTYYLGKPKMCIRDRAVVMVVGIRKFIALIRYTWVENKVYILMDQPGHMSMCKFCRITLGFTWN